MNENSLSLMIIFKSAKSLDDISNEISTDYPGIKKLLEDLGSRIKSVEQAVTEEAAKAPEMPQERQKEEKETTEVICASWQLPFGSTNPVVRDQNQGSPLIRLCSFSKTYLQITQDSYRSSGGYARPNSIPFALPRQPVALESECEEDRGDVGCPKPT